MKTEVKIDWFKYENEAKADGYNIVCGIDEAGRGPLAGPVCAAAVILPDGCIIEGVNDSKKLTEKKREQLFDVIKETAVAYSIATADEKEIDEINILQATYLAMNRAFRGLSVRPDMALVDGNRDPGLGIPTRTIVKGDANSMSKWIKNIRNINLRSTRVTEQSFIMKCWINTALRKFTGCRF